MSWRPALRYQSYSYECGLLLDHHPHSGSANAQDDLAEHVPRFHALVRLRCVGEREFGRDGNLEFASFDGLIEAQLFLRPGDRVVRRDGDARARVGLRTAVGIE